MFKPMLADKAPKNLQELRFPVMISPKLDGIRCTIQGRRAKSRSLKDIPNEFVQRELAGLPEGLDGELMVRGVFNEVQSGIMSEDGEPDFTFNVFDAHESNSSTPFKTRYEYLRSLVFALKHPRVVLVEHELALDVEQLIVAEEEALANGYEGVMIRDPNGPYKEGRSTTKQGWLLKLKRFEDSEGVIIGYEELMHNENEAKTNALGRTERSSAKAGKVAGGTLGKILIRDIHDNRECAVGTGFTSVQRASIWALRDVHMGKIVKYKYQPEPGGTKEYAQRCPVFIGFRDARDMGE